MRKSVLWVAALVMITLLALPMGASAQPAYTAGGSGCAQWYTIQRGDTLSGIARRFATSVDRLAALNGISNPNHIIAGTTICVVAWPPAPPPPAPGFNYTVQRGDTLGNIGWRFGWSALYLAQVNHIPNPNLIFPGQVLWIPGH